MWYLGLICSALPMLSPEYDHVILGKHTKLLFYSNIQKVSHLEMMVSVKGMLKNTDFTVGTYVQWYKVGRYHEPVVLKSYQRISIPTYTPTLQVPTPGILNRDYFSTLLRSCKEKKIINPHIKICKRSFYSFTVSQSNSK